jgi:hypothetical protein
VRFDLDRLLFCEHRVQGSGHHLLVGFRHRLEQVPDATHAAALPATALQQSPDLGDQTAVDITDDQLDPYETALFE